MSNPKKYTVGSTHPTNNHGDVVIVRYRDKKNITVRFKKTGSTKIVAVYDLAKGQIADPRLKPITNNKSARSIEGKVFEPTKYGNFTVIYYESYDRVLIEFHNTGSEVWRRKDHILDGHVSDPIAYKASIEASRPPMAQRTPELYRRSI